MRNLPICIVALLLLCAPLALAHPEGFSGMRVRVWNDHVTAYLTLHTRDTSAWFPPTTDRNYAEHVCREIVKTPADILELKADNAPLSLSSIAATSPEVGMIQVELTYPLPRVIVSLEVWSRHLVRLPRGHQQLVFVEDMRPFPPDALGGHDLGEATLNTEQDSAPFDIPPIQSSTTSPTTAPAQANRPTQRISFFLLGVEHIVTGYDHLLFLAALLLVCKSLRQAAAVITFFTVAHSITLTLAALDIVRLPPRIVEPAIAASIVYVGLENIFGTHRIAWRAGITFAFGLVHGLGFASALREVGLGLTSVGIAWPLLKFSIGLETGQLCIAAVMLQILLWLRKRPAYVKNWVPACSIAVATLGGYWLVTRVFAG